MKKKFLSLLIANILCLSMAGCGQTKDTATIGDKQQFTPSTAQPPIIDGNGTLTAVSGRHCYDF